MLGSKKWSQKKRRKRGKRKASKLHPSQSKPWLIHTFVKAIQNDPNSEDPLATKTPENPQVDTNHDLLNRPVPPMKTRPRGTKNLKIRSRVLKNQRAKKLRANEVAGGARRQAKGEEGGRRSLVVTTGDTFPRVICSPHV